MTASVSVWADFVQGFVLETSDQTFGRTAIVVVGMHRSGTSALTGVFGLLGCMLPRTLLGPHESNEFGHFESVRVCDFNDRILEAGNSRWDDWTEFDPAWRDSAIARDFREEAAQLLDAEFGDAPLIVFKDPRLCRLAPFWFDVLSDRGFSIKVLLPLRNPLEVAASLTRRNGFEPRFGHLLWLRHVLDAEHETRGFPRIFTSYDGLLDEWRDVARRAGSAFGLAWPRDADEAAGEIGTFLSDGHRHHRESIDSVTDDPSLSPWLRDAYAILRRWTRDGENAGDYPRLDEIRRNFNAAVPAFDALMAKGRDLVSMAERLKEAEATARVAIEMQMRLRRELAGATDRHDAHQTSYKTDRQIAERIVELLALNRTVCALRGTSGEDVEHVRRDALEDLNRALAALLDADNWPALPTPQRMSRQVDVLERSELFDRAWYLQCYGDVAAAGRDPARHFILYGFNEGRAPNADVFATSRQAELQGAS